MIDNELDNRGIGDEKPAASATDRLLIPIATGLGVGLAPVAPGTWGSLWGLPLVYGMQAALLSPATYAAASLALILLGVAACNAATRHFGRKDPPQVVIDEIAAFPLVFAATDFDWLTAVLGFVRFRILDVWKPWPIRRLARLPGGWGVMADDLLAGVLAGAMLWGGMRIIASG